MFFIVFWSCTALWLSSSLVVNLYRSRCYVFRVEYTRPLPLSYTQTLMGTCWPINSPKLPLRTLKGKTWKTVISLRWWIKLQEAGYIISYKTVTWHWLLYVTSNPIQSSFQSSILQYERTGSIICCPKLCG